MIVCCCDRCKIIVKIDSKTIYPNSLMQRYSEYGTTFGIYKCYDCLQY